MTNKKTYFLNRETLKYFLSHALIAFGTIWLLIEFPSSVNKFIKEFFDKFGDSILIYALLISILWGLYRIWPKRKIFKKFNASNTSVEVSVGDIFDEKGNFAIGSSNFYDTNFDIANLSLKSQLINRCFNSDILYVDKLIDQSLTDQQIKGILDPTKTNGKQYKFPIGTTVKLNQNNRLIFTLIISELVFVGTVKHTISNPELLNTALTKFWEYLKAEGRMKSISIPVLGSGLARVNLSFTLLIQLIILSFVTYSKTTRVTEKLRIVVHEKDYNPNDFEVLRNFLNSIEI